MNLKVEIMKNNKNHQYACMFRGNSIYLQQKMKLPMELLITLLVFLLSLRLLIKVVGEIRLMTENKRIITPVLCIIGDLPILACPLS